MPSALLAHPIVFAAGSYVLRVTFNFVTQNRTLTVTPGRYYWTTGDGQADGATSGGVGDLLALLQATINSHTESPNCTVSLVDHRVVIAVPAGLINVLWVHANTTLDRSIFGFTATTGLVGSATGAHLPRGLWRPRHPVSEPDTRDRRVSNGGISETLSGRYRVSDFGASVRERSLAFRLLNRAVALDEYAAAPEPFGTFEQAWESMRLGRPFRLYPDETQLGSSAYTLYRTRSLADPLSRDSQYSVRWAADLKVARHA